MNPYRNLDAYRKLSSRKWVDEVADALLKKREQVIKEGQMKQKEQREIDYDEFNVFGNNGGAKLLVDAGYGKTVEAWIEKLLDRNGHYCDGTGPKEPSTLQL